MWSDITSWIADKTAGLKVLAADFNLLVSYIKKVYDNTVYLKTLVTAISNTTLYTSSSYAMTDSDGYRNIFVYANTGDVTITLSEKASNLNRPVRIVYVKGGTYKVIINPHANDANTLSGDGMDSFWLAKVGDYVDFIESADTGFWEIVNERITSNIHLSGHAGYGSGATRIPYFTNVDYNNGNCHTLTSNNSTDGLKITIKRSGRYAISYEHEPVSGEEWVGLSLNTSAPSTSIRSITVSNKLGMNYANGANQNTMVNYIKTFTKNDIIRPQNHNVTVGTTLDVFNLEYLGN